MSKRDRIKAALRKERRQANVMPTITATPNIGEPIWQNPPNEGRPVIEHIDTFVARATSFAKTYFNPDVAYQEDKNLQKAMVLDPVVMEPLRARQLSVALLEWSIKPEDDESPGQKECCERITRAVQKIPYFTKYRLALSEAIWYGRYGVQNPWIVGWDVPTNQPRLEISRNRQKPWIPVHGDKFRVNYEDGRLGVMVRRSGTARYGAIGYGDEAPVHWLTPEERDCFVFHQHEILDGDFFDPKSSGAVMGLGLRHRVWWPWYFKQSLRSWVMEFAQRVGTGTTIWYFNEDNPDSYAHVKAAAEAQSSSNVILFPRGEDSKNRGAGIERIEASTGGAQFLLSLLTEGYERQIKMMIAGQTATSEAVSTGLGSSVADQHANTKGQIQAFDAQNLDETLTLDLLGPMCNYPKRWAGDWHPRFESTVQKPDPVKLMAAAKQLFEMGGAISEDELRELAGLRKPREGEGVLLKSKMPAEPSPFDTPPGEGVKSSPQEKEPELQSADLEGDE